MKTFLKISGIAYVFIFISGFYANFIILETLIDSNKSSETIGNIINNSDKFKNGLIAFLIMIISDILLVWSLFKVTKPIHKTLSHIASIFRGFHAVFFIIALFQLFKIYNLICNATYSIQLETKVFDLLLWFDKLWTIGLLFFAAHLLVLSYLILKSSYTSKFIGYFLIVAAVGYFIDCFSKLYFTNYSDYKLYFETMVVFTAIIGELSFTLWLIFKGFSKKTFRL